MKKTMALLGMLLIAILSSRTTVATSQPKPGCPASCGDLTIPFPFGTSDGCYLDDSFLLTCNNTYNPPKTFLGESNIQVFDISLDGQMGVTSFIARNCYNESGSLVRHDVAWLRLSRFFISSTRNKFTAVGCDTVAVIGGSEGQKYASGCVAYCDRIGSVANDSCLGAGCCQTSIPPGARDYSVEISSISNHTNVSDFNPCGYAFVVEEEAFSFSSLDLMAFTKWTSIHLVLDWAVGNETCEEAKKNSSSYACQDVNSECYNSTNGPGYRCNCSSGYEGNPYLMGGCQGTNTHLCLFHQFLNVLIPFKNNFPHPFTFQFIFQEENCHISLLL
uniref:Putative wall-associated receptor kinase 2-like n=1 Tax=Davidia involucrata TaxID=16924 RepID=A0A5B7BKM9_DAVIN